MKYDNWTKAKRKAEIVRLNKKMMKITAKIRKDLTLLEVSNYDIPNIKRNTITAHEKKCECGRVNRFYTTNLGDNKFE